MPRGERHGGWGVAGKRGVGHTARSLEIPSGFWELGSAWACWGLALGSEWMEMAVGRTVRRLPWRQTGRLGRGGEGAGG